MTDLTLSSRKAILLSADRILRCQPGAAARHRLLREVLGYRDEDPEAKRAKAALLESRWVRLLQDEQHADGSWCDSTHAIPGAGKKL
jgi:hypothetical protein